MDYITITHSVIRNNSIRFRGNKAMEDYLKTKINIIGCVFAHDGLLEVVTNSVEGKEVVLNTSSNLTHDGFSATVIPGNGVITVQSDLPGLK